MKSYAKTKTRTTTNRKNAVIYARYSSASQNEQSIEGQLRVITEFAKKQGYHIIETYIDRAMTGRNDDRPDFQRMISDSFNGEFDYVIVYKLDRFSRNRYDSAVHKRTLRNNGVKVISATEQITDTPEGIMFESIIEGYNEFYSAELATKVKRSLNESRIKGNYTGAPVILGYEIVNKKWTVKEDEAALVRKMFADCANGVLIKNIAANLNERHITTKNGNPWTINRVSRVLNNERYCGIARFGDEVYKNIIPPIIDDGLFAKVKNNLTTNNHRTAHFRTPVTFYLSGKLFCMNCGAAIIGESGTGKTNVYHYYKCSSNKRKRGSCAKKNVRQEMLEDYVIDKIQQYILQPKYIMTVAAEMSGNFNAQILNDGELDILKKAQAKNEKELQNTLAAIRMGIVTESTKDMLLELEEKRDKYATEIVRISNRKRKTINKNECADFLFSLTALDFSKPENRKLLFDRFIRRVELGNRKIRIFFYPVNKPYLYSDTEDDLTPPDGYGEDDTTEEPNTSPPPQSCSSVDASCPPIVQVTEHNNFIIYFIKINLVS